MGIAPLDYNIAMITQKDVAQRAGVSIMTVSRVLNGSPSVRPETRERVLRAMEELGYHPHSGARSLARRYIGSLGVVAPLPENIGLESNPYFIRLLQGIEWACIHQGYDLLISSQRRHDQEEFPYFRLYFERKVDGLIFLNAGFGDSHLEQIERYHIPSCVVGERPESPHVDVVDTKNREGVARLVEYVVAHGHSKIGFLHSTVTTYHIVERFEGFKEALSRYGLRFREDWVFWGDFSEASGAEALDRLLSLDDRPTALICGTDSMAIGVIRRARERGVQIPGDLSLTGFDNIPEARVVHPALTTMEQPLVKMGERAAELLLERVQHVDLPARREFFETTLVEGETVGHQRNV